MRLDRFRSTGDDTSAMACFNCRMADGDSWSTALTTLAGVGAGSFISYVAQYQAWTRSNRRDAYGVFIASTTSWFDAMGQLRTALTGNYSEDARESFWGKVNDARTSSLAAFAQVRMLGRKGTGVAADSVISLLQDLLNRLHDRDFPDIGTEAERFGAIRDRFVESARRELTWRRAYRA